MSITIQEIFNREQWNTFVISQSHGHFLQSFEWGELRRNLGEHVYRVGVLEDGRLIGAMLFTVSPVPLPLPKLRPTWLYCARGPVLERLDVPVLMKLLKYVERIAQREHAVALRVEPNIADDDPELDTWLAVYHKAGFQSNPSSVHGRRSWVLDIQPADTELFSCFKPAWQEAIYLAERQGVTVRLADPVDDFSVYYELLRASGERDALFVHSKEYHQQILQLFAEQGQAVILLAEQEGRPVGAKLLLSFGDWCWDMFGGFTDVPVDHSSAHLLQYHALQWAQSHGCRFFDFRSIPDVLVPGEDLWEAYEYKRGFHGFSRLTMPTQDYIYQPLLYKPWRKLMEMGREQRHKERLNVDFERQVVYDLPEVLSDAD